MNLALSCSQAEQQSQGQRNVHQQNVSEVIAYVCVRHFPLEHGSDWFEWHSLSQNRAGLSVLFICSFKGVVLTLWFLMQISPAPCVKHGEISISDAPATYEISTFKLFF